MSSDETWLLQFLCLVVEVMVPVLPKWWSQSWSVWGGGSPQNTKSSVLILCSDSLGMPKCLPWLVEFPTQWCNAVDYRTFWESLIVDGSFEDVSAAFMSAWLGQLCLLRSNEYLQAYMWMSWFFPRGEFSQMSHLFKDFSILKNTIPPQRICLSLFSCLVQPLAVASGDGSVWIYKH